MAFSSNSHYEGEILRIAAGMVAVAAHAAIDTLPAPANADAARSVQVRLSNQRPNAIQTSWPGIGCWFGGRRNFHPVWPPNQENLTASLLSGNLLRAEGRIRLLNYISTAPIDCPVAIVFGHPAALNWAAPGFAKAGIELRNGRWISRDKDSKAIAHSRSRCKRIQRKTA